MLQIDCAQQGFNSVGQDARLVGAAGVLLTLAQQQVGAETVIGQMPANVGQRMGVDDAGAQLGQVALGAVGVSVVELLGDGQPRNSRRSLVGSPPFS